MDHLISAKIVLADGSTQILDKNSDLFFGIKGAGGGNYGIITEFTFCPCWFKGATVFEILYPFSLLETIIKLWQDFAPFTDRKLSSELDLSSPKFHDYPIKFKGQFEGPKSELKKLIKQFIIIPDSKISITHIDTFAEAAHFWGTTQQSYYEWNSIFWNNKLTEPAIDQIKEALFDAPGPLTSFEFNAMLGAVSDIKPNETAFPYRNSLFLVPNPRKNVRSS